MRSRRSVAKSRRRGVQTPVRAARSSRAQEGFRRPRLYPLADGRALGVRPGGGWHGRVRLEFCGMYYRLNLLGARIQREQRRPGAAARVRGLWRVLGAALRRRDALEDRWTPRGVVAEPVLVEGLVADVRFTFPDIDALGQPRLGMAGFSSAAVIAVLGVSTGADVVDREGEGVC